MENIIIKNISEATIGQFKSCFDLNGSPKNKEIIRWQFLLRENYKQYVDIAYDEANKKTAAIYAVAPVPFKIANNKAVGTQSLDTITDIDYRGKGWFVRLANSVFQKAANDNVALVYGFPNGNSIHGFVKKLEWKVLDPVPFLIKPINSKYFTDKMKYLKYIPNVKLSYSRYKVNINYDLVQKKQFPREVNELWNKFSKNINVAVDRNKEYLDWRYISKPGEDYKIIHCYNKQDQYLGYIVYVSKAKHGGQIGYIMELVYDLEKPEVGKLLLKYANSALKETGADCILSWCMKHSPNYSIYKKSFFLNMPEKLKPIELHMGVRAFNDEVKEIVNKRENWYISYSDSDTV